MSSICPVFSSYMPWTGGFEQNNLASMPGLYQSWKLLEE